MTQVMTDPLQTGCLPEQDWSYDWSSLLLRPQVVMGQDTKTQKNP